MVRQTLLQQFLHILTHDHHVLAQPVLPDDPLHFRSRGTSDRMTLICLSVGETASALLERLHYAVINQQPSDGSVPDMIVYISMLTTPA